MKVNWSLLLRFLDELMISELVNKDRHKSKFWICVFPLVMTKYFLGQVLAELVVNQEGRLAVARVKHP